VVKVGGLAPQLVLTAGVIGLALAAGRRRDALAAAVLVGGADLTTQLLKGALHQWRFEPLLSWSQVGPEGFPSGHTTTVAALALAWSLVVAPRWRLVTLAVGAGVTAAVCWAVVVSRWHYPSDALGGVLVALTWYFGVAAAVGQLSLRSGRSIAPMSNSVTVESSASSASPESVSCSTRE